MSIFVGSPTQGLYNLTYKHYIKHFPPNIQINAQKFFNGVWPKWFFSALQKYRIDPDTFQPGKYSDIIDPNHTDIAYFCKKNNIIKVFITDDDFPPLIPAPVAIVPQISQRVRELYTGPQNELSTHVCQLAGYYKGLEGPSATMENSNFLSIPPKLFINFVEFRPYKKHELFGSPFNTWAATYSSAFKFEVKYFSSSGSYESYAPPPNQKTLLIVNPPFDETMMADAAQLCIKLKNSHADLLIVFVIPNWPADDFEARRILEEVSLSSAETNNPRLSKFFKYGRGELVSASASVLFLLGQTPPSFTARDIMNEWAKY